MTKNCRKKNASVYKSSIHKISPRAKLLKLADKTSNLRAIAASPPPGWSVKRRLDYVEWARRVSNGLTGVSPWLEGEFERASKDAKGSILSIEEVVS